MDFSLPVWSYNMLAIVLSHPLIAEILFRVHGLGSDGTSVVFMWVPNHVGLTGLFVA